MDHDNDNDNDTNVGIKNLFKDRALAFLLIAALTSALVVTVYHFVTVCLCNRRRPRRRDHDGNRSLRFAPPATPGSGDGIHLEELIPAHKFRRGERDDVVDCTVCLSEFQDGEEVRALPGCAHTFHAPCIDMWLFSHSTCPICRAEATPSPVILRTPEILQEATETRIDFRVLEDTARTQSRTSSASLFSAFA